VNFLDSLAARRRFGMKPGLETIVRLCAKLGNPQNAVRAIHVAGTNGKGAVCAILDSFLRAGSFGRVGRYTSPHLIKINERFFIDGKPVEDAVLEESAERIAFCAADIEDLTFFEALSAIAFEVFARKRCDWSVLETGLGGRLDATNICRPELCVITRIGLDHCDWLGGSVAEIAAEKAGIIKPGVPVVLGRNADEVRRVVEARAAQSGSPFFYAPDIADEADIPADFSLSGSFNRENALTAIAAVRVLFGDTPLRGFGEVVWPGRFQRVGRFVVDGAHNPPACKALIEALCREIPRFGEGGCVNLVAGFCGDKDVDEVLKMLAPFVDRAFAVRTGNPRSLAAAETASKMRRAGMAAEECTSLSEALDRSGPGTTLVCGSLFLAGEALAELGAYPWPADRRDPSELLRR
jgi:dihydrofolate synthase/folylpolyglutamate synthase